MKKNIFVIGVLSMIAMCYVGCEGKKTQQDIVYKTDAVRDWPSEFHDSANNVPVYDFHFPFTQKWKKTNERLYQVIISGDVAYFVTIGNKIWITGCNIKTGKWIFADEIERAPRDVADPHLVVRDDMVYFAVTATNEYQVWSYVYAYNMKEKKIVWRKEVQWEKEGRDNMMYTGVLLDGNIVVAYFGDKQEGPKMIAYTATTGEELWRCSEPRGRMYNNDPVISNGKIFVLNATRSSADYTSNIIAISLSDGEKIWETIIDGLSDLSGLLAYNKKIHVATSRGIFMLNEESGQIEVSIPRNEKEKLIFLGHHILTDGQCFYTEISGGAVCYTERGDVVWKTDNLMYPNLRFTTKNCVWASSAGRFLVALDKKTGKIMDTLEVGTSKRLTHKFDITDVAVKDTTVFITTEAGDVYAFEGSGGR